MESPRPYRSPLREERAQDTRRRIRQSAGRLFADRGFAATTVAQIAEHAGVSVQTVYAIFGGKSGVVGAMLEELEQAGGIDERVPALIAEPDPHRQLRMFIAFNRAMFERSAPILRAAIEARGDPQVAAIGHQGDARRREGTIGLAEMWAGKGALREGLSAKSAAEQLWLLSSAEQYLFAVDNLDWSPEAYERWLGDLLERELLAPGSS